MGYHIEIGFEIGDDGGVIAGCDRYFLIRRFAFRWLEKILTDDTRAFRVNINGYVWERSR